MSAEYIQATSRVGRDPQRPGLIVTLLNAHKSRDRSHYERFENYHASFYRGVEATSVTPFSPRALDRALPAALVGLCRLGMPQITPSLGAAEILSTRGALSAFAEQFAERAANHQPPPPDPERVQRLRDGVRARCNKLLDELSVISIPNTRRPVDDAVRSLWEDFLVDVETPEDLVKARRKPTVAAKLQGISDEEVFSAISRMSAEGDDATTRTVKEVEFEALAEAQEELGSDVPDGYFFARSLPPAHWQAPWMQAIERVVLVHRLREVIAQVGFTRFEAAGPDIQGELMDLSVGVERAPLANVLTTLDWMRRKGYLTREKKGKAFVYAPRYSREEFERGLAQEALGALLGGLSEPVLSTFVELVGKDEEKLERLEELIRRKRREKK